MNNKVLFLSFTVSLGGFLFGFDAGIISGVMNFVAPEFELNEVQTGWVVSSPSFAAMIAMIIAGKLSDNIIDKLLFEDLDESDLTGLKNLNVNTLNKFAISYADAVVQASEKINKNVLTNIQDSGKPFMEFPGEVEYENDYLNFYSHFIKNEEKVSV